MRAAGKAQERVFQHVVELLHNEHLVEAFREPCGRFLGERVRRPYLPETIGRQLGALLGSALLQHAQRLARIGRRHAARHDAAERGTSITVSVIKCFT